MTDTSEMEPIMADEPTPPAAPAAPDPAAPAATTEPPAGGPVQLPDDHPLVKAFSTQKSELADAKKRLNDIDEANKTDAQKQADALAALQTENETLKATAMRAEVAASKGVPPELLSGSTKEELDASADALLSFKGDAAPQLPGNQRPAGPVSQVQVQEETREDRIKRLNAELKR